MAKTKSKPEFDEHLKTVRAARERVDEAVSSLDQALGMANRAVRIAWEYLFDDLCQGKREELSTTQLNIASGIIYRLTQTMEKLHRLEGDVRVKNKLLAEAARQIAGLPEEMREGLEREFKLM